MCLSEAYSGVDVQLKTIVFQIRFTLSFLTQDFVRKIALFCVYQPSSTELQIEYF